MSVATTAMAYQVSIPTVVVVPDAPEATEDHAAKAIVLETRLQVSPEDGDAWRELGWSYWHLGRLDEVRRVWETWRRLEPDRDEVHALIGRLELAENRLEKATTAFRQSLDLEPDQDEVLFDLARTLRWTGHLLEAIERLRDLYASQPEARPIRLELARALSSNWDYAEALPLWSLLRAETPDDQEIRLGEATALLHTGSPGLAVIEARRILRQEPNHVGALTILANESEFNGRPDEAVVWLERLIDATADPSERQALRTRLLKLLDIRAQTNPCTDIFAQQLSLARTILDVNPHRVEARLTLSALLLQQNQLDEAETILLGVLREFSPNLYRAQLSLFEIALVRQAFDDARQYLEQLQRFHPSDPYLDWYAARLHAAAGDAPAAEAALDRLAAAGERGATAILLYHALTPSDYGPPLSVARFQDHLRALMGAGYSFITPDQIQDDWQTHGPSAGLDYNGRARRVVVITFDDALDSAMRYGTEIGLAYGMRFAQHVVAGFVDQNRPYLSGWEALRRYAQSGVWVFGSHLYEAHDPDRTPDGEPVGQPIANRRWMPDDRRHESEIEAALRIREEYDLARERIAEELGVSCRFIAYPYGDIGQSGRSNLRTAVPINLQHAGRNHEIGFIQTPFAHAVPGANPLLYGRHEMDIHWTGDQVVQYLIDRHPLILAERTRLEFAQWQGQPARARQALNRLREIGYPAPALRQLADGLQTNLAPVFATPGRSAAPGSHRGPDFELGTEIRGFQDNLKARNFKITVNAASELYPDVHLAGGAGTGRLTQRRRETADIQTTSVDLNETLVRLGLSFVDQGKRVWTAGGGWRRWSGDADGHRLQGMAEVRGHWTPEIAMRVGVVHDTPEQARALANGLSYTRVYTESRWVMGADGSLLLDGTWDSLSDNNLLLRVSLSPVYHPVSWHGLYAGIRFAYIESESDTPDYWTPRNMTGWYAAAGCRNRLGGGQFDLRLQAGVARETVFEDNPGVTETADLAPAVSDPGWEPAHAISAGWRRNFSRHWNGGFQILWSTSPNYEETRGTINLDYRF